MACFVIGALMLVGVGFSISPSAGGEMAGALGIMWLMTLIFRRALAQHIGPTGSAVFAGLLAWLGAVVLASYAPVITIENAAVEYGVAAAFWIAWRLSSPQS